jgi:glycosyltransferase involved in cell wall biosynthesis
VLVFTTDPIGPEMPGPAIRAWHLAEVIGRDMEVVLASTVAVAGAHPNAELVPVYGTPLAPLLDSVDVVFAPSSLVYMSSEVRDSAKPLAVDIYDPYHLENLERSGPNLSQDDQTVTRLAGVVNAALRRGDFFTCASERQRDFWLGSLAAVGRVNPYTYASDPLLERFIGVVPFGLPPQPPRRHGPGLRGVLPGVSERDKVVLWGGGVYDWLDPLSVIHAVGRLTGHIPNVRLVFLGMRHPNPTIPEMAVATAARALAEELGLAGRHVFFNDGWVPYERRGDYLLDADVAVSTHLGHLETRYSFRTRVLDYIWAGLPMVLTGGDTLADELAAAGVALVVPPGDVDALEHGLARMLTSPPPRSLFGAPAERYRWERVAEPLVAFCRSPRRAPDLLVRRPGPDEAAAGG